MTKDEHYAESNMNKTEQRLAALREEEKVLLKELDRQRGRKLFRCACGNGHMIKDLFLTEYYSSSGGEWSFQEHRIDCIEPGQNFTNRLLWDTPYSVDWTKRDHYAHCASSQFSRLYNRLFKKVPADRDSRLRGEMVNPRISEGMRDDPKKPWVNNHTIDHNHAYWGIKLKDFPYEKFHAGLKERARHFAAQQRAKQKETASA